MNTQTQLLHSSELRAELGASGAPVSPSTIYYWKREGLIPPPIKIGGGRLSRWVRAEVMAVIAARIAGSGNDEVRALVRSMVAARSGK